MTDETPNQKLKRLSDEALRIVRAVASELGVDPARLDCKWRQPGGFKNLPDEVAFLLDGRPFLTIGPDNEEKLHDIAEHSYNRIKFQDQVRKSLKADLQPIGFKPPPAEL